MTRAKRNCNQKVYSREALIFIKLLQEADKTKLTEHFIRYGIDTELAKLNLEILIAEEMRDLGLNQEDIESEIKYGT